MIPPLAQTLPTFPAGGDPGSSFSELLSRSGLRAPAPLSGGGELTLTHATTIVAVRYNDGVVMAGDRRATAGNVIAHRTMDKVFPADKFSGVSISGVAGLAAEMVKMFQLELEHFEKVEGAPLSLEGKANRLGNMIRQNLPSAMSSGMVVIPIFAGYDLRRKEGRIYNYDVTGGRYEEMEFHATGSGGIYARGVLKQNWQRDMSRDQAVDLCLASLFEAADEDSATGGPDAIRGIYPSVATITAGGYDRLEDVEVSQRFETLLAARSARLGLAAPQVAAPSPNLAGPDSTTKGRKK
jgi:proteasome beta subunit